MVRSARPDLIFKAICMGNVQWKESAVRNMLQDPKTKNFTANGVKGLLCKYASGKGDGCVKAREEKDEYWLEVQPDDPWWYKVNIELTGRPDRLFVKMKLVDDDEQNPWAEIVGCHF
jgi:hypothetical protein